MPSFIVKKQKSFPIGQNNIHEAWQKQANRRIDRWRIEYWRTFLVLCFEGGAHIEACKAERRSFL
jgi:hypothetical protein